jgi:23S rRNA pseudouridine1911/1915/1917 synthase
MQIEILYQDADIVVVNKPQQTLTIPDRYRPELPSVVKQLEKLLDVEKIWIVHRLDKDTSGVLCFALNAPAHRHLSIQFEHQHPCKRYWALVEGVLLDKSGVIDAAIEEHPTKPGLMSVQAKGKPSVTHYQVLEEFKKYTIVEAQPKTGRTHQIRVHLAYLGYPLAVDPLYGTQTELFLSDIKQRKFKLQKHTEEQPMLARVPLHAHSITLKHPTTEIDMTFTAALPKDLQAVHNQLVKWGNKH